MGAGLTTRGVSRLVGFDTSGEAFVSGDRVLRGIYRGDAKAVRDILDRCERDDLFRHGIISTQELRDDPHPELGYETVLEHERVPFVTYPHEWSASMLRDAALFHVELFQVLGKHGLTLKDWHPYNILFDGTTPKFVDFTSIIPAPELRSQSHLSNAPAQKGIARLWDSDSVATYENYRLMYEPYFGLPLEMMKRGRHAEARRRLYETALNSADSVITRREVFADDRAARIAYELADRRLRLALIEKGPQKRRFFRLIEKRLRRMDVALKGSAYSSYYEEKNEAFSIEPTPDWNAKQHSVRNTLVERHPKTVLDLGSNTGWFSILAARLGSKVVAVDLDEASIDSLYAAACRDSLPILPLVANLTQPLPDRPALEFPGEPSLSRIGGSEPLYPRPNARLQCDMVLALAVIHHLSLGQGLTFEQVSSIFSGLGRKYLCVEFVAIDDPMITSDRAFFPAYNAAPDSFGWYSLDNFISVVRRNFPGVEIRPSHPGTRTMVVFSR
ncbi:MAG TPA: class I SAM-dependent methyltransferase [Gemmatimonadaceae bacterium]|nr:class I SAM-dependent methyltransferase [Gemmatimonadaceae bacterium]